MRATSMGSGIEPSGNVAVAMPGHHVVARIAPAVLDVRGELLVEELERVVRQRVALGAAAHRARPAARPGTEPLAEQLVIALRDAEQVGDDEHGEGLAVPADELATAAVDELVDLAVGEAPHELLVLAEALRRDQAHEQCPMRGVDRRVERDQLVAHRELAPVLLDERVDVVALERDGEAGERSRGRVARREPCRCRCRPRSPRRTRSPSSRRGGARAAPGTGPAASRSTGTGRRRARGPGRSRWRRSRSRHHR